jgi:hypothetical protein
MSREFHRVLGESELAAKEMKNAEVELGIVTCCDNRVGDSHLCEVASSDYRRVPSFAFALWV